MSGSESLLKDIDLSGYAFVIGGKKDAIPNKGTFYTLWEKGLLGNKPRSWKGMEEFRRSGYRGSVHFRYAVPGSPFRLADVPYEKVEEEYWRLVKKGAQPELIRLSESLPAEHIVMHGHLQRSPNYFDLEYSLKGDDLQDARGMPRLGRFASGVTAKEILQHFLCPNSYDDLAELLNCFPDSIIEFTVYDRHIGILMHRNTIVWEVRNY